MQQYAEKLRDDPETAQMFHWNILGRVGEPPDIGSFDTLEDFCELASSEMHEQENV